MVPHHAAGTDAVAGTIEAVAPLFPGAIAHPGQFPVIEGFEDIRPHLRPDAGIRAFEQGNFLLVRYTTALPETFQSVFDLECRSLLFERRTGALLSRPFHKFFILGERQGLGDLDLSVPIHAETKLDGSMVAGFVHDGEVLLHTRGGLSKQARAAARAAPDGPLALVREAWEDGFTPIFEYTSPANRVVIAYERETLTLLALRERRTGRYDRAEALRRARKHGVAMAAPLFDSPDSLSDLARLLADLRRRRDIEGAVLVWPDGHRLKVKTDDYHRRHKILANIAHEQHVYRCFLEDLADDTAAALGGARGRALIDFMGRIEAAIDALGTEIGIALRTMEGMSPQDRAEAIRSRFEGSRQTLAFAMLKGREVRDGVLDLIARRVGSAEKRAALKADLNLPDWDIDIQALR